ncbi:MAG: aldehyde dehydrogenase [Candidatus Limivicinus sp.]|nr:aldehyde dehydrogenase [Clostridiales bacterium]MDY3859331.1 aldehyde dehydrogenase [Candidatus Limivicinus sp.]
MDISSIVESEKQFFRTGVTRGTDFRIDMLKRLRKAVIENDGLISAALRADLNKQPFETYMCETGLLLEEIDYHIKHLKKWSRTRRVRSGVGQLPGKSYVCPEPYGVVLIMAPWNYPVQLCLMPLVGAVSSGNCAVVKPSAYAPESSRVIAKIIESAFPTGYVTAVEGGRDANKALLEEPFDYIFFTGSVAVGKTVMEAAAKRLTPVTLELGGKSPVIVDETADLALAARRIAFGKVLNAGQTCVAPDYLMIEKSVETPFIEEYKKALADFFPGGDMSSMVHIINDRHFERLCNILDNSGTVTVGGTRDAETRFIEPAVLTDVPVDSPVMEQEIFGPILPILPYDKLDDCIDFIRSRPKPLALYIFSENRMNQEKVLGSCSFGGGCINDTVIHLASSYMSFGGVGASGMGCYHGKQSFDTLTHYRSVLKQGKIDVKLRYFPYSSFKEKLCRWLLK